MLLPTFSVVTSIFGASSEYFMALSNIFTITLVKWVSFAKIDDFNEIKNSRYDGIIFDHHPDIKCHQKFVTDYIYPKLNLTMKDSTDQDIDSYWNQAKARFKDLPSKHDWPIVTGCADSLWGYGNWERNTYYDL